MPSSSPRRSERSPSPSSAAPQRRGVFRTLGLGLITCAADDDPSAIGTYAIAGAKLGPSFLWTAPVTMPMMFAAVYLSSKLGQVSRMGLFDDVRLSGIVQGFSTPPRMLIIMLLTNRRR